MESVDLTYKHDASAGDIPASIFYKSTFASAPTPRPVVMIIHGGGYTVCGTFIIPRNQIQTLLDMGFIVVTPEYRLCPQVTVAEGPVEDVRSCLRWIKTDLKDLLEARINVSINPGRVAVMGHSAGGNMALILGGEPNPPNAILDVYGSVYPGRSFHHEPLPLFAALPDVPKDFTEKVFEGPVPVSSPPMMKAGKPDLSTPRNAWMCTNLKNGTQLSKIVKDGDYSLIDGPSFIKRGFPPTAIVHGEKDNFVPYSFSVDVAKDLEWHGVEHELVTVPGQDHMFDIPISKEDALFGYIQQGLDFIKKHV